MGRKNAWELAIEDYRAGNYTGKPDTGGKGSVTTPQTGSIQTPNAWERAIGLYRAGKYTGTPGREQPVKSRYETTIARFNARLNAYMDRGVELEQSLASWQSDGDIDTLLNPYKQEARWLTGAADYLQDQYGDDPEFARQLQEIREGVRNNVGALSRYKNHYSQWDSGDAYDRAVQEYLWYQEAKEKSADEIFEMAQTETEPEKQDWLKRYLYQNAPDRLQEQRDYSVDTDVEVEQLDAQLEKKEWELNNSTLSWDDPVRLQMVREVQDLQNRIDAVDRTGESAAYAAKYDGKTSRSQWDAYFTLGQLGQDSNAAWSTYLDDPTEENLEYAQVIDQLVQQFRENNAEVLEKDTALPWVTKDLASYLPQLFGQIKYGLGGMAAASPVALLGGGGTTLKVGITAGRGLYSYDIMRGAAFRTLREAGFSEEKAREMAKDEAFVSTIIEMGDTALTLFGSLAHKPLTALGKGGIKAFQKAANTTAGKNAVKKLLTLVWRIGKQGAGEWLEESTQEAVSIANGMRNSEGKWDLAKLAAGIYSRAMMDWITGQENADTDRIVEAGNAGGRLGLMMGGAEIVGEKAARLTLKGADQLIKSAASSRNPNMVTSVAQTDSVQVIDGVKIDNIDDFENIELNPRQKQGMELAKFLAALGVDIHVYKSEMVNGRFTGANGMYMDADGSVHIDLMSGQFGQGDMAFTISHEMTHFIEKKAPEKFRLYADALIQELGVDGVTVDENLEGEFQRLRSMVNENGTLTYDGMSDADLRSVAYSELIARYSETMLTDTDAAKRIMNAVRAKDAGLWKQICRFFSELVDKLRSAYAKITPDSPMAQEARQTIQRVEHLAELWSGAAVDAVWNYRSGAAEKNTTAGGGGIRYMNRDGEIKQASQLSEEDLYDLLELVEYRQLDGKSLIPLRATTPQFLIDVVREHSKGTVNVQNLPMAATVEHLAQNMEEDDGTSYGEHRPHGLSKEDTIAISREMGHPSYIVRQRNGRYAEVVSFYSSQKKRVVVAIDFADPLDKHNYRYQQYMNGYNEGYYNIIVTEYEPDSLKAYLQNTEVVYDRAKMNGKYQVGSGRVVTITHDMPFMNSLTQDGAEVKSEKEEMVLLSSREPKWIPNLDNTERGIVKYIIGNSQGTYITKADKMFYQNSRGKTLFGIYSTDDGTLLYVSKGKTAEKEKLFVDQLMEVYADGYGTDTGAKTADTRAETVWMQPDRNNGNRSGIVAPGRRGRDAGLYVPTQRCYASAALRSLLSNILTEGTHGGTGRGRGIKSDGILRPDRDPYNQALEAWQQSSRYTLELLRQKRVVQVTYPDFDLSREMEDPVFARMVQPGVGLSVEQAFYACHMREVKDAITRSAVEEAVRKVERSVRAGQQRPRENGMSSIAPSVSYPNYRSLSPERRKALKERIHASAYGGPKVYPGDLG